MSALISLATAGSQIGQNKVKGMSIFPPSEGRNRFHSRAGKMAPGNIVAPRENGFRARTAPLAFSAILRRRGRPERGQRRANGRPAFRGLSRTGRGV